MTVMLIDDAIIVIIIIITIITYISLAQQLSLLKVASTECDALCFVRTIVRQQGRTTNTCFVITQISYSLYIDHVPYTANHN